MARIRSIKPEFWSDEKLHRLPWFDRLLFIALWNFSDDEGRGRAIAKEINGFAFPLDDVENREVEAALQHLHSLSCIRLYEHEAIRYFHIPSWSRHQVINRPTPSRLPAPNEDSLNTHGVLTDTSIPRARAQEVEMEVEQGNGKGKGRGKGGRAGEDCADKPRSPRATFTPPSLEDCRDFFAQQQHPDDAESFHDYYTSNGWHVGRSSMREWHSAARNWIRRQGEFPSRNGTSAASAPRETVSERVLRQFEGADK